MNDLATTLACCVIQVTLAALSAALLYAWASRRGPGAAALPVASSFGLILVLTALAFCPLPRWWAWESSPDGVLPAHEVLSRAPSTHSAAPPDAEGQPTMNTEPLPSGLRAESIALWRRTLEGLTRKPADAAAGWQWREILSVALLAAAGVGLLRLLLGLLSVRRYSRRSRRLDDPALCSLAESFRQQLGCPRPVELRETPDFGTPATVGWFRPVILLPLEWRDWSEAERQAALAHELAHVRRRDFLARLLAQLSLALHCYNPLVHWLAGRLRLQQELAADALAAPLAGGRGPYLRALARLTLRQDRSSCRCPVPVLFSSPGTLMRRIQMLRTRPVPCTSRPLGRAAQLLLLAVVALGLSALRSPAREEKAPGAAAPPPPARPDREAPFELSYLPPDAQGVVAFRPAALFGRADMKEYADRCDKALATLFPEAGQKEGPKLSVRDIEQVVGPLFVQTQKGKEESQAQTNFGFQFCLVRTSRDFDWKGWLHSLAPQTAAIRHAGKVYYKPPQEAVAFLGPALCYHVLDGRTLICGVEKQIREFLEKEARPQPAFPWADDWKRVERGLVAVAFDNRDKRWLTDRRQPEQEMSASVVSFFQHAATVVGGVYDDEGLVFEADARCNGVEASNALAKALGNLIDEGMKSLDGPKDRTSKEVEDVRTSLRQLLLGCAIEQQPRSVGLRTRYKGSLPELIKLID